MAGNMSSCMFEAVSQWNRIAGNVPKPEHINILASKAGVWKDKSYKLLDSEVEELHDAKSRLDIADALGDIFVTLQGCAYHYGLDLEEIVQRVMESNYSKFCVTKEEAQASVDHYNKIHNRNYAEYIQMQQEDREPYYVILRRVDGKVLKGINFVEPYLEDLL